MNIQSFSIVVPNIGCLNLCPFCVSRMHYNRYENKMDMSHPHYDINIKEYMKRMRYVADQGCRTLILTGTSEPQQNKAFLNQFALMHQLIGSPFTNIEMQTTGIMLDGDRDYVRFLRNFVGVNTIALSLNALDEDKNCELRGGGAKRFVAVKKLCDLLKEYDFNIRICLNLSNAYDEAFKSIDAYAATFSWLKNSLHADQVTLRMLYTSGNGTEQDSWIEDHRFYNESYLRCFLNTSKIVGHTIYGTAIRYINGMSVIYDQDCMAKKVHDDAVKYLILQPDCKLYSQWDDPASLVF